MENTKKFKARQLVAAGGLIFRIVNGLPKGLIKQGETVEKSALREVKEETGLDGEIVKKIGEIGYNFHKHFRREHYFKTVHFYLLKYVGGSVENHDIKVDRVQWFPISEVLRIMRYNKEKDVLKNAEKC
ncbi:MAG: NUDIX hydrolase [Candidatus Bathycorpusculaceae bacterium]